MLANHQIRNIFSILFLFALAPFQLSICQNTSGINDLIKAINDLSVNDNKKDSLLLITENNYSDLPDSVVASLHYTWGLYYQKSYQYDSAKTLIELAIDEFSRINGNELKLANAYHELGHLAYDIEDISYSISCYHKSLEIYEKLKETEKIANVYNGIGNAYAYISELNLSLSNYEKSKELYQSLNDSSGVAMVLGNIAHHYTTIKEYKKAISFFEKSLVWSGNNKSRQLDNILGIGIVKEETKVYDGAEAYYREAARLSRLIGDLPQLGFVYQNLAFLYLKTNELDSIPKYVGLARELGVKYQTHQLITNLDEIQHEYLYKKGEYQLAYDILKKTRAESDSFYNIDMTRQLQEVQAKYSSLQNERELARKNQELEKAGNELASTLFIRNGLILGLALVIVVVVLIYRSHKMKAKANELLLAKNKQIEDKNIQIKSIEEAKSKWFINISHELRTPLTLIKGPISQALKKIPAKDQVFKDLEIADRNIGRLQRLVDEILNISMMEEGKLTLQKSQINLTELILSSLADFDNTARRVKVKVELDLNPEDDLIIEADRNKIGNLLGNLISNALKFTHEGGIITIGLTHENGNIVLFVKDTGEGIPEEDLPYIFNRFYQSSAAKVRTGGTGIGLALCQEIAKLHGGELTVCSELGKGSTFTLILPGSSMPNIKVDFNNSDDFENSEKPSFEFNSILRQKQILIVDDNSDMREYISSFLKNDYEILEARDGVEAIEILKNKTPDLIVSDIMMPRMDGMELAKEVKNHPEWKNIPYITVSAIGEESEKVKTLRIGIDDYLVKPFYSEELFVRINNLINNHAERMKAKSGDNDDEPDESLISDEEKTLKRLEKEVMDHIDEANFNVLRLAEVAMMSERQLYRYLKHMTGLTPANFVREIRLQKAMELIQKKVYRRTSQISYAVGFSQPSYFSTVFKKRFGRMPAEYFEE